MRISDWSSDVCSSDLMQMGFDVVPWVRDADVILVVEATVPWVPREVSPRTDARVIHLGEDPLRGDLPIRTFPCDLAITAEPKAGLDQLAAALARSPALDPDRIDARRSVLADKRRAIRAEAEAAWERDRGSTDITSTRISLAIDAVKGDAMENGRAHVR